MPIKPSKVNDTRVDVELDWEHGLESTIDREIKNPHNKGIEDLIVHVEILPTRDVVEKVLGKYRKLGWEVTYEFVDAYGETWITIHNFEETVRKASEVGNDNS